MALTDTAIRAAKPRATQFKLYDEKGLFLIVKPSGGKLWRLKYRMHGKEQQFSIGLYPDVSLKEAHKRREEARQLIAQGKHPRVERKRREASERIGAANTFEAVANELIAKGEAEGRAPVTSNQARWLLLQLKPISARPIAEVEAFEILDVVKVLEKAGRRETARRALAFASRVFRYGIVTTRARSNPAGELRGALVAPKVKHHAAILDPERFGGLLRAIDDFQGQPCTRLALQLAPHVFVRPAELRQAGWTEIDLDASVWRIPAGRMKMKLEHVVPLSLQAVAILAEIKKLTGAGHFLFPSVRTTRRPMSENTLNAALRRMGYGVDEMTSHGFRSTASTLLNESGKWSTDAIERALAHKDTDHVRAAYHRGVHWQERVKMAQWWSDHLDVLRKGATIIPMHPASSTG